MESNTHRHPPPPPSRNHRLMQREAGTGRDKYNRQSFGCSRYTDL